MACKEAAVFLDLDQFDASVVHRPCPKVFVGLHLLLGGPRYKRREHGIFIDCAKYLFEL